MTNFIRYLTLLVTIVQATLIESHTIDSNAFAHKISTPQKLSDCSAKLDNGVIIDLKSLDNAASPRFYIHENCFIF